MKLYTSVNQCQEIERCGIIQKMTKNKTLQGRIRITAKPLGFVEIEGRDEDIMVYEENLNCTLDKDTVEVEIIRPGKGKVTKILERNKTEFVGTLEKSGNGLAFVPDDWKFYKKIELRNYPADAKPGLKALVKMKEWTNPNLNPLGEVVKIIGESGKHETEMQSILLDKGIVYNFPQEVEKEAAEIERLNEGKIEDKEGERRDFRNITTFTIDPVDAKDFDDALSYEELDEKTLRIGVHIADVSYFVRPGTALDREARKRALSTYLVDRTIPMLPEVLSNGLCSLVPNEDRLAFSAVFDIDKESGKVLSRWFGRTVINSDKRFSYEEAQEIVDSRQEVVDSRNTKYKKELEELDRISKIYRAENKKNGAIEFETEEVKFELDEEGKPIRVYKKARLDTMKMIEEWMLLANREVAKFIADKIKNGGASIFRIHDLPKADRIEELAVFVRALGHELPIRNGEVSARDINALLAAIEGHASESLIKTAAIRSMAKAIYSTKNIGHFGLAFEYYTHFTSPIRRYADLVVHRVLQKHLTGGKIGKDEFATYQRIAEEVSEKEITIAEAERESIKYKQVEFMQTKIGQEFEGVITGVTEWGIYVEHPETKAEGMVRLKDMTTDQFELDQKNYAIVGSRTKKKLSLGDTVRVQLVAANLERKTIDLKLV
jgi:ribonuclease R